MKKTIVFVHDIRRDFTLTGLLLDPSQYEIKDIYDLGELAQAMASLRFQAVDLFVVHNNPYPSLTEKDTGVPAQETAIALIRNSMENVPIITFKTFPPTTAEVELSGPLGTRVWNDFLINSRLDIHINRLMQMAA
jgi:hypothetical protein